MALDQFAICAIGHGQPEEGHVTDMLRDGLLQGVFGLPRCMINIVLPPAVSDVDGPIPLCEQSGSSVQPKDACSVVATTRARTTNVAAVGRESIPESGVTCGRQGVGADPDHAR